tara:strand:+ start:99 stop:329 length:231 start_codon:yes stop_codon:yes gene_type:complete
MSEKSSKSEIFHQLSQSVENGDPQASKKIRELLNASQDLSEMRYLEGLLMMMGEATGELEDPPDQENDPEEYWEEY